MSGNNPELSVILPVYNVAPWLFECLDSVAAQTFTNFEAILVDDGSTDFSGLFCDSYARKDSRFRVIHQSNQGVSAARNVGIEAARAPLLAFIDPDDFISPNFFDGLITALRRENADVAVSGVYYVEEDGDEGGWKYVNKREIRARQRYKHVMKSNDEVLAAMLHNLFSCVAWGKVYTKALWGCARFPVGIDLGEDMNTIPALIAHAQIAVSVPNEIYYWRQRKKSLLHGTITRERFRKDLIASKEMALQLEEHLTENEASSLKLFYDICCLMEYRKSNPGEFKTKSALYIMLEAEGGIP